MRTSMMVLAGMLAAGAQAEEEKSAPAAVAAPATAPVAGPAADAKPATPMLSAADLEQRIARHDPDVAILDVRTPEEFAAGHVPGAINVSHEQVAVRLDDLKSIRGKQVVVYCRSGRRAALAEDVLRQAGFQHLLHLQGDYLQWEAGGHAVERVP